MSTAVVLKSLIQESKDGEWGKGEPFEDSVKMAVIRGTDFEAVRNGNIDALPIRYIPRRIADRKTLQPNDILLETAGGSKDRPTGRSLFIKSSIIHRSVLPLTCASFSRFIRIDPTKADPRYIFWHLQYLYDADYLRQYHTQHTGVARFQYTVFSEGEELLIQPLPIQRIIAAILSAYDDLIENNNRRIEILEEMARSLYREWFVNFRFPGHEQVKMVDSELGLVPEGWEVKPLSDVCSRITDGSHWSPKTVDEGYPMASVKDMHTWGLNVDQCRKISEEDYMQLVRNGCKPLKGDVLITKDGNTYLKHIFVIEKEIELVILSSIAILRPNEKILPYLLAFYLREPTVKPRLANYVSGAAIPRVVLKDFKRFSIVLPSRELQDKFFRLAEAMVKNCHCLLDKNANLRKTRDLLLPKLISGEINLEKLDIDTEGLTQWAA